MLFVILGVLIGVFACFAIGIILTYNEIKKQNQNQESQAILGRKEKEEKGEEFEAGRKAFSEAYQEFQSNEIAEEDAKAVSGKTYREVKKEVEITFRHLKAELPIKIFTVKEEGFPTICKWYFNPLTKEQKEYLFDHFYIEKYYTYKFDEQQGLYITSPQLDKNGEYHEHTIIALNKKAFLEFDNMLVETSGRVFDEKKLLKDKRFHRYYIRKTRNKR